MIGETSTNKKDGETKKIESAKKVRFTYAEAVKQNQWWTIYEEEAMIINNLIIQEIVSTTISLSNSW